jgi:autophagy-related protein 2
MVIRKSELPGKDTGEIGQLTTSVHPGQVRVRLHDASVRVLLHDGYDWQRTRKTIEDEMKAVRRRLERIRQLLASGQKADESVDRTSSVLFNSIYIGVDQRNEMDAAALIQAIDDELEGMGAGDETASQSSWQTMPSGPGGGGGTARPRTGASASAGARLRGKRLTRSKKPQIEIALRGIKADVDVYAADDAMAKRLHVTAQSMEILDHIKTSTWKKFLTELKADSRGNIRETDADMVRVEVVGVRPNLPDLEEELRLRVSAVGIAGGERGRVERGMGGLMGQMKILPLKLHVDQDALDFLKAFFGFQLPAVAPQPGGGDVRGVSFGSDAKARAKEPFFRELATRTKTAR